MIYLHDMTADAEERDAKRQKNGEAVEAREEVSCVCNVLPIQYV